jgi:hypothetical protein
MTHPSDWGHPRLFLRYFLVQDHLPFKPLLTVAALTDLITRHLGATAETIYTPLVTLALFLRQVVDADHSCRNVVEHLAAARIAEGLPPCADDTGGYCKARQRLPLGLLEDLVARTGSDLQAAAEATWLFHGRPVKIVDGTGCSMPDTAANARDFDRPTGQEPGVGFPMARVLVVVSLACGAVLAAAIGRGRGKQTGEGAALRGLHDRLQAGDIALGDSLYGTFLDIALLAARGVDVVFGLHARRAVDFRTGRRLGPEDHLVCWAKPRRPAWMDRATYAALPATLTIRELRLRLVRPGFRTRVILLATTLIDAAEFPKDELAALSRRRWHVELDIRSLKGHLAMDVLRCKSPAMVRKEIEAHLLVYNLIRGAMAAAARAAGLEPRRLSFQGARQTLRAFGSECAGLSEAAFGARAAVILGRLSSHRVGDRPDRFEPRERRRRPKRGVYMKYPRTEARRRAALRA